MRVTRLAADAFRNLENTSIEPDAGLNVIYGENAQGKTNLMEAIWVFTGARSFRGARESDLIPHHGKWARVSLCYEGAGRNQTAVLTLGAKRQTLHNGVECPGRASLAGSFCAVVFSPSQLRVVTGAPQERRRMLDTMICQLKPRYLALLHAYERLLAHRNALLRSSRGGIPPPELLEPWDTALARAGVKIMKTRRSYLLRLREIAQERYCEIARGRESLSLEYRATGTDGSQEDEEAAFLTLLHTALPQDAHRGFTSVGPHRDDVEFLVDEKPARTFASQGQQRSAVLAYKLGECVMVEQTLGEPPVLLLDDVMSELDESRQDYLLHRLSQRQVFITCCNPCTMKADHAAYEMRDGRLIKA